MTCPASTSARAWRRTCSACRDSVSTPGGRGCPAASIAGEAVTAGWAWLFAANRGLVSVGAGVSANGEGAGRCETLGGG